MTINFATSNLSKIKPKLRTQGRVSGNFGRPKAKAGSSLRDIGVTNGNVGNLSTQTEYLNRLKQAYQVTTDTKLKQFIFEEIRKILIQTNQW
jgi:hypothetical protein